MRAAVARALSGALLFAGLGGCASGPPRQPDAPRVERGAKLLPARVRRLSNAEYERAAEHVLGVPVRFADRLPQDVRQEGFTENADQAVVPAWSSRVDAVIREVVASAVDAQVAALGRCPEADPRVCRERWLDASGARAFRRPLAAEERAALLSVFEQGEREGGGIAGGVGLVLVSLLEAPSTLYLSELGAGGEPGAVVSLNADEIASLLAFTVHGGPPDAPLLAAALRGELADPARREREARRLLGASGARHHFRRFVLEWLEVDGLANTAKNALMFPGYDALRGKMLEETSAFVDEVMVHGGASVRSLLDAGFASVGPEMARFYGLATYGPRANLAGTGRAGLLQHASFLAAHSNEDGTSPVLRGDFVLRKLLCQEVRRPQELGIEIVIPQISSTATTRERYARHLSDPSCAMCHRSIDALGYTFEGFDAEGRARSRENGRPVDTRSVFDFEEKSRRFANSLELSRWLSTEPRVRDCFARHAFRFFSAQSDRDVEATYLGLVKELPDELAGNLVEQVVLYVKSDLFVRREVREP